MTKKAEATKAVITITTPADFEKWFAAKKQKPAAAELGEAMTVLHAWLRDARKSVIVDQETMEEADALAKQCKKARLVVENFLKPGVKKTYDEYKERKALMDGYGNPFKEVEDQKKGEIISYNRKMEQIRHKAAEKAQREAEAAAKAERKRLEKEALEAMDKGDNAEAEQKLAEAEQVSEQSNVPVAQPAYMPPPGTSIREKWIVEVIDFRALVKAVHERKAPLDCLLPNEQFLRRKAATDKETFNVPGVTASDEGTVSMRTKK